MKTTCRTTSALSEPTPRLAGRAIFRSTALAALLALSAMPAKAATVILNLTGTVSQGNYSSQDSGGLHFDQWVLSLTGLNPGNAVTVSNGDIINASIQLDQVFTIPASDVFTSFAFFLNGTNFPPVDTATAGNTAFFTGATAGPSGPGGGSTHGALVNGVDFFPPNNGAISFDRVQSNFTITNLSQPATVDGSLITYSRVRPLPEPHTLALLLGGMGVLGVRRKRGAK